MNKDHWASKTFGIEAQSFTYLATPFQGDR